MWGKTLYASQVPVEVDADKGTVPLNALENGCTPEDLCEQHWPPSCLLACIAQCFDQCFPTWHECVFAD